MCLRTKTMQVKRYSSLIRLVSKNILLVRVQQVVVINYKNQFKHDIE
jgi:hypothetical protein